MSRVMIAPPTRALQSRARELAQMELQYQFHESFADRSAAKFLLDLDEPGGKPAPAVPAGLPAHLARLCEQPLLSAAEERHRFRRMNYAKYKAQQWCRRLVPRHAEQAYVQRIERLLEIARVDRDAIISANTRLAISIARRFVGGVSTFDELLSEALETLIRAADKFDFSRGFRFSTYATTAIARSLQRSLKRAARDRRGVLDADAAERAAAGPDPVDELGGQELDVRRQLLMQLVGKLDARESFILAGRFGLGEAGHCRSLISLAADLGVCKERVRQLQHRAIEKLRILYQQAVGMELSEIS